MNNILSLEQARDVWYGVGGGGPTGWSAIVPAAGKGSRLGYHRAKILYPVLGRPILDWLLCRLTPLCEKIVLVVSPGHQEEIRSELERLSRPDVDLVLQPVPLGMADAILQARSRVRTKHTLVIWGDQIGISDDTLMACQAVHHARPGALLTLPSHLRRDPYIHLKRDRQGRIVRVCQAREGEVEGDAGENDCGLFLFETARLFSVLDSKRQDHQGVGRKTGEYNLLPLLPCFEEGEGSVVTVRIEDGMETMGINTRREAELMESYLTGR